MISAANTRTLLFGIFVVARLRLSASQVIRLAAAFAISATNVKSHLTRMVAEGVLQREGPVRLARYWPTANQAGIIERIQDRLAEPEETDWNGEWLMLALRMPPQRSAREHLKGSLWFDGFRPWSNDVYVRPAWPRSWAAERV